MRSAGHPPPPGEESTEVTVTPLPDAGETPAGQSDPHSGLEPASPCIGHIDAVQDGVVFGWAWNPSRPEVRLSVDIVHCGKRIDSVTADTFRVDLKRLGIGDGGHAFTYTLPDELRHATVAELGLLFGNSAISLPRAQAADADDSAEPGSADPPDPEGVTGRTAVLKALQHRIGQLENSMAAVAGMVGTIHEHSDRTAGRSNHTHDLGSLIKLVQRQDSATEDLRKRIADIEQLLQNIESFLCIGMVDRLRDLLRDDLLGSTQRRLLKRLQWLILVIRVVLGLGVAAVAGALTWWLYYR